MIIYLFIYFHHIQSHAGSCKGKARLEPCSMCVGVWFQMKRGRVGVRQAIAFYVGGVARMFRVIIGFSRKIIERFGY